MHSGKGAEASVEGKAFLVSGRTRRSDDQSGYPTVLGATYGRADSIGKDRSRTIGYCTGIGRRNDPYGCNQRNSSSEDVEAAMRSLSLPPFRRARSRFHMPARLSF